MYALRRIFITSEQLSDRRISRDERDEIRQTIKQQIQVLWKTDEVRVNKPTVEDEIRNGLYFFRESLFDAIPETYRYLDKAIHRVYGDADHASESALTIPGGLIHFGSWIGGDRDGNPFVKPPTTTLALRMHMREVLITYLRRVEELSSRLTHSSTLCEFSTAFMDSLNADEQRFPDASQELSADYANEHYRRKLYIMRRRLKMNLTAVSERIEQPGTDLASQTIGYDNEQELLLDLQLIYDSLVADGDANLADAKLKDLIRLVETFGFYLMHLDIRQESTRHTEAVTEILKQLPDAVDYASLDEPARQQLITRALATSPPVLDRPALSDDTRETLHAPHAGRSQPQRIWQLCHLDDTHGQPHPRGDVPGLVNRSCRQAKRRVVLPHSHQPVV
jgi:phosphoenolpyruvate carboxylase